MKRLGKVFVMTLIVLSFMAAMPSIRGITQSFRENVNPEDRIEDRNKQNEGSTSSDEGIKEDPKEEKEIDAKDEEDLSKDNSEQKEQVPPIEKERDSKSESDKTIFLTFDDGPSTLTPEILRILAENDVKATFFTIGKSVEKYPEIVKQTYKEGHMVLPHTYSHEYSIYTTLETYYEDLELAKSAIEKVLNIELPYIFRFAGGSSNESSFKYGGKQYMPKLTEDVKAKGYYYIDWNVSSGDASADYDNKEKMLHNVIEGTKNKNFVVALFHDTARNTKMAEVLEEMIISLKGQGYTFRTFRDITQEELDTMVKLKISNKPIKR